MISQQHEEDTAVRRIMVLTVGTKAVRFKRAVTVKTRRTLGVAVFDGPNWNGELEIREGEVIPISDIARGEKAKPCRLNVLAVVTIQHELKLHDVPEDSYIEETVGQEKEDEKGDPDNMPDPWN